MSTRMYTNEDQIDAIRIRKLQALQAQWEAWSRQLTKEDDANIRRLIANKMNTLIDQMDEV